MYAGGGLQWLLWGFCLPTMTLAHATFAINTVNHLIGSRRFDTIDESRNNVVTAFFAAGEGWHNNHHRYQRAARNGFYWWSSTSPGMSFALWRRSVSRGPAGVRNGSEEARARVRQATARFWRAEPPSVSVGAEPSTALNDGRDLSRLSITALR
jgi:hypothetical protein